MHNYFRQGNDIKMKGIRENNIHEELKENRDADALTIEIINSEKALEKIEDEWNNLISESRNSSIFSTFQIVKIAWKHFHSSTDKLFILVLKKDNKIVGIAPFKIRIKKALLFPIRVIGFIAEWGDGDKPCIATTIESEEVVWHRIYQFLQNEYKKWDWIVLTEQPIDSIILKQDIFFNKRYYCRTHSDTLSFYTSLNGTWNDYLKNVKGKVRENWRRRSRNIEKLQDGIKIECFEDTESIASALEKFILIEQSGWKKNQNFSVGGNDRHKDYFRELMLDLARRNMVSIYLLVSGNQDIAASIVYKFKNILYAAHIAHKSEFSKYSPGVILNAEVLRLHFGTCYEELDFFGLHVKDSKQKHKSDWATGTRETVRINIFKKNFRHFLYSAGKGIEKILKKMIAFCKKRPLSIFF